MLLFDVPASPIQELQPVLGNRFFIKRDDLIGFGLGGNKVRKMAFFIEDALAQNADVLVTYGDEQSNHCRVAAITAAHFGLDCVLIRKGEPVKQKTGNGRICTMMCASDVYCTEKNVGQTIAGVLDRLKKEGRRPYFIPGGGHGRQGTAAYYDAFFEIAEQERQLGVRFDMIFLTCGTGATQAGLVCGKMDLKHPVRIVGISIARLNPRCKEVVMQSCIEYFDIKQMEEEILVDDAYTMGGYGARSDEVDKMIAQQLKENQILLDPVYTGKAFYGMCEHIKRENIVGKTILFLHTGGQPVFYA